MPKKKKREYGTPADTAALDAASKEARDAFRSDRERGIRHSANFVRAFDALTHLCEEEPAPPAKPEKEEK